jgi:hypothetical protein
MTRALQRKGHARMDDPRSDMNAPRLELLRPEQRARLTAIEASGLSQPGTRLMMETLGLPPFCRLRNCRRAKACLGKKFECMRDNRELLLTQVLPQVMGYVRDADG